MSSNLKLAAEILGINDVDLDYLKIEDEFGDLVMLHYNDKMVGSLMPDNPIRQVRGTIVDVASKKVVCGSFGYVANVEASASPLSYNMEMVDIDGKSYSQGDFISPYEDYQGRNGVVSFDLFAGIDGTHLRVWVHNGEIMVSSHKTIMLTDKSRWGSSEPFRVLFDRYLNGMDINLIAKPDYVANFILVNPQLMVSSKFPVWELTSGGCLIFMGYTSSSNSHSGSFRRRYQKGSGSLMVTAKEAWESFPYNLSSLKEFRNYPNRSVFGPWVLEENEVDKFLTQGFYDYPAEKQDNPLCLGEGVVLSYGRMDNNNVLHRNHIRIVSSALFRREKIVKNDPNVLHRSFTILTESQPPSKGNADEYLDKFPPMFNLTDSEIETLRAPILTGPIANDADRTPSKEELEMTSGAKDYDKLDKRFRNAMMWYAMSLSPVHQLDALRSIHEVLRRRNVVLDYILNNRNELAALGEKPTSFGKFGPLIMYPKEDKTVAHIIDRVAKAYTMAKANTKVANQRNYPKVLDEKFQVYTRSGVLNDNGEYINKIYKVLYREPEEMVGLIDRNTRDEAPPMAGAGGPNPVVVPQVVPDVEINFDLRGPNDAL